MSKRHGGDRIVFKSTKVDRLFDDELRKLYPDDFLIEIKDEINEVQFSKLKSEMKEQITTRRMKHQAIMRELDTVLQADNKKINAQAFIRDKVKDAERRKNISKFINSAESLSLERATNLQRSATLTKLVDTLNIANEDIKIIDLKDPAPKAAINPFKVDTLLA